MRIAPRDTRGGGVRGSDIQKSVEAVKWLDRLGTNFGSRLRIRPEIDSLNTSCPSISEGVRSLIQVWESCQTAGPIGTKLGARQWIHLGMDI